MGVIASTVVGGWVILTRLSPEYSLIRCQTRPVLAHVFGPSELWPDQDLIGFSSEFDADLVVAAYYSGAFPMPLHSTRFDYEMGWWSPVRRGVLELNDLRCTDSLRKSSKHYLTSVDVAFEQVLAACADPKRPDGWIDPDIVAVYTELHRRGIAHSVESWDASGRLVGGLYGVSIGALFAGESMFHDQELGRDASKVALVRLVEQLRARPDGEALLDVQWITPHLASLGASEIERDGYLMLLSEALNRSDTIWPNPARSYRRIHA